MGLRFVNEILEDSAGVFIYTTSSALDYYIRKKLKEKLNVSSDYILSADTDKELNTAMDNGLVAPMEGDKWIIHVNLEKITLKILEKAIKRNIPYAYFVFWMNDFKLSSKVKGYDVVKKYSQFFPMESLNFLSVEDTEFYLTDTLGDKIKTIDPDVYQFVVNNYRYEISSLSEFIMLVQLDEEFPDRKSVIDAIGVGSVSTDRLLMKILTADASTQKKAKNRMKELVLYYDMLRTKYEARQIMTYLSIGTHNLMQLKQLQIMGYLNNHNTEPPQYIDMKKMKRYFRYIRDLQENITMIDLLNFKTQLELYREEYDGELAFMCVITKYLSNCAKNDKGKVKKVKVG